MPKPREVARDDTPVLPAPGTCGACRHWTPIRRQSGDRWAVARETAPCTNPEVRSRLTGDERGDVWMAADFGCIFFAAKGA